MKSISVQRGNAWLINDLFLREFERTLPPWKRWEKRSCGRRVVGLRKLRWVALRTIAPPHLIARVEALRVRRPSN